MRLSLLLLAGWFLLATTSHAHADPVSAIVGIISAVAKIGTLGQLVLGVALKVGASLLSRARGKREDQRPAGVKGSMTVGGDNPMSFIIGTYATAGQLEYVNSYGKAGKTPNAYLVQVVSLSDLPISAMSSAVWINGEKCTIDWNAAPTDAGYPVLQYRQNGTDHLWVRFRDGTQTAVDSYLLSTFGADATRPWQADMIGRGVAYAIVTARVNREVMTSPPRCKFVLQGIKLYDIRKDTTAGGSGPHRWADPSTWEWSDNTKVAQYNLLRGLSYNGEWFYGGQNLAAFQLPASNWMAAMNECDRLVAVAAGGTEKQFRCGAEIALSYQPLEAIKELDKSCSGRTAELGGIYKTICGMPGLPVYSFADEDIVITSEQQQDPYPSHQQTYNGAHASYPEPAEDWAMKDAPPRYNAAYEAADDDQRLIADLSYPMVPYGTQVQRLMFAAIEEERRFGSHTGTLSPEAWLLEPLDAIAWTSARNGYDGKLFLLGDMDDLPGVNQVVAFRELDPLDYSWSSDKELPVSVGPTGPIVPPPQPMTGWAVEPAEVPDATGAPRRPAIKIRCAADLDDVARVHVVVRVKATGSIVFDSDQTPYPRPGSGAAYEWLLSGGWCVPNTLYQAQGVYVPFSARVMEPSGWLDVLTPNVLLGDGDIYAPGMIADLQKYSRDATEWLRDGTRKLLDEQGRIARIIAEQDFANFRDKQTLRRELVARSDLITASYTELVVAATGPGSAIVGRLETLEAKIPGLATVTALNSLTAIVTQQGNTLTLHGQQLTDINAVLPNKAEASAVNSLSARVTSAENGITANSDAITSVSSKVGKISANGTFRVSTEAAPSGALARVAIAAAITEAGASYEAAFFLDAMSGGKTRALFKVGQFAIIDPNGTTPIVPFIVDGGVVYIANVKIKQAQIDDLLVGTSNIIPGAVTRAGYINEPGAITVNGNSVYATVADVTISHGANSPPVFVAASLQGAGLQGMITKGINGNSRIRLYNVTENYVLAECIFDEGGVPKRYGPAASEAWSIAFNYQPAAGTAATQIVMQCAQSGPTDGDMRVSRRTITAMALIRS